MSKVSIATEVELTPDFVYNVLITAFDTSYGGCNYWATVTCVERSTSLRDNVLGSPMWTGVRVIPDGHLNEYVSPREGYYKDLAAQILHHDGILVDAGVLAKGFQRCLDAWPRDSRRRAEFVQALLEQDAGMIDANDADAIVQKGLFREVVVG